MNAVDICEELNTIREILKKAFPNAVVFVETNPYRWGNYRVLFLPDTFEEQMDPAQQLFDVLEENLDESVLKRIFVYKKINRMDGKVTFQEFQKECLEISQSKGFCTGTPTLSDAISQGALIHSECSEYIEDLRKYGLSQLETVFVDGKPTGIASELADIVVRTFTLAAWLGIDLEKAIQIKMEYNKTRPVKHGGKLF